MKINKPKFWDNKNSKILPYLLLPLSLILIGVNLIKKSITKKEKIKFNMYWQYLLGFRKTL